MQDNEFTSEEVAKFLFIQLGKAACVAKMCRLQKENFTVVCEQSWAQCEHYGPEKYKDIIESLDKEWGKESDGL